LTDGFTGYARDYLARNAAHAGHDLRSPLYSRQFIEFAFAIPQRQRMRGGVGKYLHSASLREILPEKVLLRRTDVYFNLPFERLLDSACKTMVEDLLQCGIELIDRSGLEKLIRFYRRAPVGCRPIYELWAVLGCIHLFDRAAGEGLRHGF
jgi:hypothetical protein